MISQIYIMGRGHSGSTILDFLLGDSPEICGIGELISGLVRFETATCSCGNPVLECEFWSGVKDDFCSGGRQWNEVNNVTGQAYIARFANTLFSSRKKLAPLADINTALADSIRKRSKSTRVVDSSKEVTRALFLAKCGQARIIHLIRSPYEIIESNLQRINAGQPFKFLRRTYTNRNFRYLYISISSLSWSVGFLLAMVVSFFARRSYQRVYYQALFNKPSETLAQIGKFIETDLGSVIEKVESQQPLIVRHRIAGNRIRFEKEVIFKETRKKGNLRPLEFTLVTLFTWPIYLLLRKHLVAPPMTTRT